MKKLLPLPLLFLATALQAQTQTPPVIAPIAITAFDTQYTQNFNSDEPVPEGPGLATGADGSTSAQTPPGWGFVETGSSTRNDGLYTIRNGTTTSADTFSFGATGSTERAFGEVTAGTLSTRIGAQFTNNSGSVITQVTITYTGEQWRSSQTTDRLDFKYSTTSAGSTVGSLTTGTFTDFNALDFNSLITGSNTGLDGNLAANRTMITGTITGLNIGVGETFTIRWDSVDIADSDAGLAIDDFAMTAAPEPSTYAAGMLALAAVGFMQRRRLRWIFSRSRAARAA